MATIQTPVDLADVLGDVVLTENPIEALKQKGFTFSDDLQKQLDAAGPLNTLSPEQHARLVQRAKGLGPIKFTVGPTPVPPVGPDTSDYDAIAGVKFGLINQTLSVLFSSGTIPLEVRPEITGQIFILAALRLLTLGIPDEDDIELGALRFTEPPTVTPVPGTNHMILRLAFSLDFDRIVENPPTGEIKQRESITSLDGVLTFGVLIKAINELDKIRIVFAGVSGTQEELPDFNIAPGSPVQPRNPLAGGILETLPEIILIFAEIFGKIEASYSITPDIFLRVGGGFAFTVKQIDVRCAEAGSDSALMVGVLLSISSNDADPNSLVGLFTIDTANVYARMSENLLRNIVKQALKNGDLQKLVTAENEDAILDDAEIEVRTNELRLILRWHVKDACAGRDVEGVDTLTFRYSLSGDQIIVTKDRERHVGGGDTFICILVKIGQLLLDFIAALVTGHLIGFVLTAFDWLGETLFGGDDDDNVFLQLSRVFRPDTTISGTDVRTQVLALQSRVEDQFIDASGIVTIPDTVIHAAFQTITGQVPNQTIEALAGVTVELVDQDVPQPAGDDITLPPPTESETVLGNKFIRRVESAYSPPLGDQVLARGTTDSSGRVRFILLASQLQTAARLVTRVTRETIAEGEIISQQETEKTFIEKRPDVYFRVTLPDGRSFDTRKMPNGFFPNLASKQLGSLNAPLVFTLEE